MSKIAIVLVSFVFLMFVATPAVAEMPKELKGTWILDAQATEHNIRTSSKMKPEDAKYLPTIIKRMSQYGWEFSDGSITSSRGSKKQTLSVVLKESDQKTFVFEGTQNNQIITMTVALISDTVINIRSSATDDMDNYLWMRGNLDTDMEKDNDNSLAIELTEKSLNNSSTKPDAGSGN